MFDYIFVGAGCVMANRLSANANTQVCLARVARVAREFGALVRLSGRSGGRSVPEAWAEPSGILQADGQLWQDGPVRCQTA